MVKVRYATSEDYNRIRDFFHSIGDDFYPPVSEREQELEAEIEKALANGGIVTVEKKGKIIGALIYENENETARVNYSGVAKEYRKTTVFYQLIRYIVETNQVVQNVLTKTWSQNTESKRMLEKLGFQYLGMIVGDYTRDRTTEIYAADIDDIRKSLSQR